MQTLADVYLNLEIVTYERQERLRNIADVYVNVEIRNERSCKLLRMFISALKYVLAVYRELATYCGCLLQRLI